MKIRALHDGESAVASQNYGRNELRPSLNGRAEVRLSPSEKRRSRRLFARAALCAAAVSVALSAAATQYALVVGINEYTNPGCDTLTGCVTDANRMSNLLINGGCGWTSSTVKKFTNASASRSAILNQMQSFATAAASGDTFIFYQSSHGGDNVLCAANEDITAADLGTYLRKFKSGVKVLCVIDACHSGSLANKGAGAAGGAKKRAPMDFASFVADVNKTMDGLAAADKGGVPKLSNAEIGWCTAVDADNLSSDMGAIFGGLFTYPFIQSARSGAADADCFAYYGDYLSAGDMDGECTAWEAFWSAYATAYVWSEEDQMPQMFNETVCDSVALSKSALVDINEAADCGLTFDSYAYDSDNYGIEGYVGFFGQKKTSYDGSSALACSPPVPWQTCVLDANVVVVEEGTLTFRWKASSDVPAAAKTMRLWVDDTVVRTYTGSSWKQETVTITGGGSHYVSWEYFIDEDEMYSSTTVDENCCYIDNIIWKSDLPAENNALDNTYLSFWQERSNTTKGWAEASGAGYGGSAMTIGNLPANSYASILTEVTGPCIVDWNWRCAKGDENSALAFYLDNEYQFQYDTSASSGFSSKAFYVPEGTHTLVWIYAQGSTKAGDGSDFAVLDWVGLYYPVSFTVDGETDQVDPPIYDYEFNGTYFYEAGSYLSMPFADGVDYWECDYDGGEYEISETFRMPAEAVTFSAYTSYAVSDVFMLAYASSGMFQGKGEYNGYILEGVGDNGAAGAVKGLVKVKTAKLKNGSSAVQATITFAGQKKAIKLKGATTWNSTYLFQADATLAGSGATAKLSFTQKNVWGWIYINGVGYWCDLANVSVDPGKVAAAKRNYTLGAFTYTTSGPMNDSYVGFSVQVGVKGKTKFSGFLPDGSKASGSTVAIADDNGVYVPIFAQINSKKGSFQGFLLDLTNGTLAMYADGHWDGTGAKSPTKAEVQFDVFDQVRGAPVASTFYLFETFGKLPTSLDGSPIMISDLAGWSAQEAVSFNGKKWTQMKPDVKKLSLTYVPKTGVVKGSFKILTANGKTSKAACNGVFFRNYGSIDTDGFAGMTVSVKGKMALYATLD